MSKVTSKVCACSYQEEQSNRNFWPWDCVPSIYLYCPGNELHRGEIFRSVHHLSESQVGINEGRRGLHLMASNYLVLYDFQKITFPKGMTLIRSIFWLFSCQSLNWKPRYTSHCWWGSQASYSLLCFLPCNLSLHNHVCNIMLEQFPNLEGELELCNQMSRNSIFMLAKISVKSHREALWTSKCHRGMPVFLKDS